MSEISINNVCCTCLSIDRKLFPLYKVRDGINLLYMLLSQDPEAYKEGFYQDAATLLVCWECHALIKKIKRFQTQVCITQKHLASIADGKNDVKLKTFSNLIIVHNNMYYEFQSDCMENFIDCGSVKIKFENDSDDIPLSAFCENNITSFSNVESDYSNLKSGSTKLKSDNSNIKSDNSNSKSDNSNSKSDNSNSKSNSSNRKLNNSNKKSKVTTMKETSKKKKKILYKKYYSISTMDEQEMLKSVETRKIDIESKVFKCESCVLAFKTANKLSIHNEKLHSKKENNSQCDICSAHIEDLPTHRLSHYHRYSCVLCTHTAYTHTDMARHIRGDHYEFCCKSEKPRYACPECDSSFLNKDLRWKHIQRDHREWFQCSSCDKKFAFKSNLNRHERNHQGPRPREQCPICHRMVRSDLVASHARIHAYRQTHACAQCEKHFVSRETYENHMKYAKVHATGEVCRHACGLCQKRYRSRVELRDHVNYQHNGQTAHRCPICNKGLATKRCILRHVRRAHEGIKEGARDKICQQCGKAFRDKKGLIEHERVHTGARPLACRACGRTFRQRAALHAHTRRMHT